MERMEGMEKMEKNGEHRNKQSSRLHSSISSMNAANESQYYSHKGYDFGVVTDRILKCAVAVHKELGPYFMETTYQTALVQTRQEKARSVS